MSDNEQLARAAMCYAMPNDLKRYSIWGSSRMLRFNLADGIKLELYPDGWKMKLTPNNRIKELCKAGALIATEIDRLQALEK